MGRLIPVMMTILPCGHIVDITGFMLRPQHTNQMNNCIINTKIQMYRRIIIYVCIVNVIQKGNTDGRNSRMIPVVV